MNLAYLQFGEWGGPYQTAMADGVAIDAQAPRGGNLTGYGPKQPTPYRVLFRGHWRRVYCCIYGNIGTLWCSVMGEQIKVDLDLERLK